MTDDRPKYAVESVARTLDLIDLLRNENTLTLAAAKKTLGLGHSTTHRLLQTLVWKGYALQDPATRKYAVGPRLMGLSALDRFLQTATEDVRPLLDQLAVRTGETVHFTTLFGRDVFYLAGVESKKAVKASGRMGTYFPAHASSHGKAMLATYDLEVIKKLYKDADLPSFTGHTLNTLDRLLADVAKAKANGYATNVEESEDNVSSVAMAIRSTNLSRVFGFSVASPVSRRTPELFAEQLGALRETVEIAARLLN